MKLFFELIRREFRLFFANKVLLVLFCGAPVLYGVLIGNVYKKGKVTDLGVVVVDEDRSVMSRKLIQMIDESEVTNVVRVLNSTERSRATALSLDAPCVVVVPARFEASILLKRYPELTVFIDASNTLTANFAGTSVNVAAATLKAGIQIEALKKQGMPESIAQTQYEPFKITLIKENIRSNNYLYFMLPGVLLTVLQQVLLLGLALSFSAEFESGSFADLVRKMPNPLLLLLVKILPYLLMSLGIFVLYYCFGWWYRMPLHAALLPFLLGSVLFLFAVCFLGVLGSICLPTQLKATEVLMVVATPSFILSGFTWPLSEMPVWVQTIADVIPLTHYLKIFRVLFIEQGSFARIQQPLLALALMTVVFFVLSMLALRVKIKRYRKQVSAGKAA